MTTNVSANVERFSGLSNVYNNARPRPPHVLLQIIPSLVSYDHSVEAKTLTVVDLGCGTGLSTFFWKDTVAHVIGVEPNSDMIAKAEEVLKSLGPTHATFKFVQATSIATTLPDASVDIVTASQSLHWMEPEGTFKEVNRILKHGGVFAAFDCDWPPTLKSWKAEKAYREFVKGTKKIGKDKDLFKDVKKWQKEEHEERMKQSNQFSYVKELLIHNEEEGNADRLINLALSQGHVNTVLKSGVTKEQAGLEKLRKTVDETLGTSMSKWLWSYRVRYAIK